MNVAQALAEGALAPTYVGWGWLSISVPNLIVIVLMILLFLAAILAPFPKDRSKS